MNFFLYILVSLFLWSNASYLQNTEPVLNYYDVRKGGVFSNSYENPRIGFGCTKIYENNLYAITSTNYPTYWIRQDENYKCIKPHKKVEIMKYNTTTNNYTDSIIITDKIILIISSVFLDFILIIIYCFD